MLRADVSLWSSSPCAHRALIAVSTCFPTGCRSCRSVLHAMPSGGGPGRSRSPAAEVLADLPGTQRAGRAQGTHQRPPALGKFEAPLTRVQVRTPARQARSGVGNDRVPGHHQTKQAGFGRSLPAAHAGAYRGHARRGPVGRADHFLSNSTAPARRRHRWTVRSIRRPLGRPAGRWTEPLRPPRQVRHRNGCRCASR